MERFGLSCEVYLKHTCWNGVRLCTKASSKACYRWWQAQKMVPRRVLTGPPRIPSTSWRVAPLWMWYSCRVRSSSSSVDCHIRCCWDIGIPSHINRATRYWYTSCCPAESPKTFRLSTALDYNPCRVQFNILQFYISIIGSFQNCIFPGSHLH